MTYTIARRCLFAILIAAAIANAGVVFHGTATGGTTGNCGFRVTDPISHSCLDAFIQANLPTDHYTVALSESDNIPGGTLADGFPQPPGTNFTSPEFPGAPGSFILFNGDQRDNNRALEIDSTSGSAARIPGPGFLRLFASILASALLIRRRRRQTA